jgi:hypothetical protein
MTSHRSQLEAWLEDFILEAETIRDKFEEHRADLRTLEVAQLRREEADVEREEIVDAVEEARDTASATQKPLPDAETMSARQDLILAKLTELGGIGSPEAWASFARVAEKRIAKWISAQKRTDPTDESNLSAQMQRRLDAIHDGASLISQISDQEHLLEEEKALIDRGLVETNPRSGLSRLSDVDDDLKQLRIQVDDVRAALLKIAKQAGEPAVFAAVLGKTSGLQRQVRGAFQALGAAKKTLQMDIADLGQREAQAQIDADITRELRALPLKSDAETWLQEARLTIGLLNEWIAINSRLNSPQDGRLYHSTLALLQDWLSRVQASSAYEQTFRRLQARLSAVSPGPEEETTVATIYHEVESLEMSLLHTRDEMFSAHNTYNGPPVFKALASGLNTVEDEIRSFVYAVEKALREAGQRVQASLAGDDLLEDLAERLTELHGMYVSPMHEETDPLAWLTMAGRLERALRTWDGMGHDLVPPPPGLEAVNQILGLLQRAQVILPEIRSAETEFERRRTIEFAQASTDPHKLLVLHAAFERLEVWLEPLLHDLETLHHRALAIGSEWSLFKGITADTAQQLEKLKDFHERLRLMYYDQEGGSPDEKTASQGGTLDLSHEDKDAIRQYSEGLIDSHLEEQNSERSARGEKPMRRTDIPPEVVDSFQRIARRMVSDRTSRYA